MKKLFKIVIALILSVVFVSPAQAITMSGRDGSAMQGGSATIKGRDSSVSGSFPSLLALFDVASYSGSGQTWAEKGGNISYDLNLGASSTPTTDDPTFIGTAGDKDAAFLFDGGDRFVIKANTAFINRLHKTDETSLEVTFAMAFYWPLNITSGTVFMFGTSNGNSDHGMRLEYDFPNQRFEFRQTGGVSSSGTNIGTGIIPEPGAFNFLLFSYTKTSGTGGTYRLAFNNDTTLTGALSAFKTTTTDPVDGFQISGVSASSLFVSEMKVKFFAIFQESLEEGKINLSKAIFERDYGNPFPTSIENVRRFFWNSQTDLLAANDDEIDLTGESWFDSDEGFIVARYISPSTFVDHNYLIIANDGSSTDTAGMRVGADKKSRGYVRASSASKHAVVNGDVQIESELQSVAITWKSGEATLLSGGEVRTQTYSGDPVAMDKLNFSARNGNADAKDLTFFDAYVGNKHKTVAELEQYLFSPNDVKAAGGGQSLMGGLFNTQETSGEGGKQNFRTGVHGTILANNSVTFVNGAVGGSAAAKTSDAVNYWWDVVLNVEGPALTTFKSNMDTVGYTPNILLWSQGENDSNDIPANTTKAQYKSALLSIFNDIRSTYGAMPVIIQRIGRRDISFSDAGIQAVRDVQVELAAENSWIHIGPDSYDQAIYQVDGLGVHLLDAGYLVMGTRLANRALDVLGFTVAEAVGPSISSAVRSGTSVTVTIAHDDGSDFTPTTGIEGFHFFDDSSEIAVSAAVRTNATTITLTLASTPTGVETLYYIYGSENGPLNVANTVRDNAATAMPLQSTKIGL